MKWLLLLLISSCAQVTSLNLQKHQFGILPTKIIWYQIAGLEEEHLAMLRFQHAAERRTAFEENICIGKSWSYNLYDLRAKAEESFLSQLTGKKNIKLSCEDASHRPIWNYLGSNGYSTGVLEIGANAKQSLLFANQCGEEAKPFLNNLYFWIKKQPVAGAETFHYAEPMKLEANKLFYDSTCSSRECFASIKDNVTAIYSNFRRVSPKHMLIIRDFSYLEAIDKGNFVKAKEILADLERSLGEALSYAAKSNDFLILVTSGDSRLVDFPSQGKGWYEFEKTGKNAQMKRTRLTNLVLASGARAENFCGMYNDAEVFERVLSGPKQQGLELKFINPFK